MFIRAMKCTAILALLAGLAWHPITDHRIFLQLVVSAEAIIVCTQAAVIGDYLLMFIFLAITCVFNPVAPLTFSSETWMVVSTITAIMFFLSPEILKSRPRPVAIPVPDQPTESESL